jgi:DNA ligase-1
MELKEDETIAGDEILYTEFSDDSDIPTFYNYENIPTPNEAENYPVGSREHNIIIKHKWRLNPLFKTSINKALMVWWVGYNIDTEELFMKHGMVTTPSGNPGKIRVVKEKVIKNMSNRTVYEQAILEAKSRYTKKYRNERYSIPGETRQFNLSPMLAKIWEPSKTKLTYPVAIQPKFDGFRCLCNKDDTIVYRSRNDIVWPNLNSVFDPEMNIFFTYLPKGIELDGEMYYHGLTFEKISSLIKNQKVKNPLLDKLIYYIFDFFGFGEFEDLPYEKRWAILESAKRQYREDGHSTLHFKIVSTFLADNKEDIIKAHDVFVKQGYEGIIIRKLANKNPTPKQLKESRYIHGRANNLLKYKLFQDAEGVIVGVKEGEGTEKGAVIFTVETNNGSKVDMRPMGTIKERQEWFKNPSLVIGKTVTYRYQEISDKGIPRFPRVVGFREGF